ncbi:3bd00d02-b40d-4e88-a1cf-5c5f4e8fb514 [Sclerotinia trifoliorum]|uniref:3bd00d02-b40d-4e88-a1cf-5c5f4e8fb514 n=1 Tax=Sclerotinia trifoliorum TaxID=28548 RepID=A0A8H2ZPF8_9HELO|nr:3bd00d02-b40d-4e88-a1cf-5c5f4e8fb514 [Sclerotinia trifoliorum]
MSGSICLRCRATIRHSLCTRKSTRTPISLSRTYSTSEVSQETPAEAFAVGGRSIPPTEGSSDRFIPRSVKLHGTRITTPLSPKPEDQEIPVRRVFARINVNYSHQKTDIDELLAKPTWSVRSLLPSPHEKPAEEITVKQLHHLCRLSALPLPKTPKEEKKLLDTLHLQLHFLRDIQKVDTDGIEPLRSIRDETIEAEALETIGLETEEIKAALEKEEYEGRNKRPRRRTDGGIDTKGVEDWSVTETATETVEFGGGKYFIVRSGKATAEKVKGDQTSLERMISHIQKQRFGTPGMN